MALEQQEEEHYSAVHDEAPQHPSRGGEGLWTLRFALLAGAIYLGTGSAAMALPHSIEVLALGIFAALMVGHFAVGYYFGMGPIPRATPA